MGAWWSGGGWVFVAYGAPIAAMTLLAWWTEKGRDQ